MFKYLGIEHSIFKKIFQNTQLKFSKREKNIGIPMNGTIKRTE
jgi:hypothetical protein